MDISALLPQGNAGAPLGAGKAPREGGFTDTLKAAAKATTAPAGTVDVGAGQPAARATPELLTWLARLPAAPPGLAADGLARPAPGEAGEAGDRRETANADASEESLAALAVLTPITTAPGTGGTATPATTAAHARASLATVAPATGGPLPAAPTEATAGTPARDNTTLTTGQAPAPTMTGSATAIIEGGALAPALPASTDASALLAAPAGGHATAAPGPTAPAPLTALTATLPAPVASPAWQQQLSQQLAGFSQRGEHRIELHLHPRELGPLSVSLKVDDHGAQAHFFSSHASVRGAVEQAIPQLRDALAEQGIALGEAMVGQQQQQNAFADAQRHAEGGPRRPDGAVSVDAMDTAAPLPAAPILPNGGVDLYA